MSVSASDIQGLFSEFADTNSSLITRYISRAQARISASVYGDLYDQAVEYLTAHLLSVEGHGSAGGSVTKEKVGDLEVHYAAPSSGDGGNGSTNYYDEFLDITARCEKASGPISLTI